MSFVAFIAASIVMELTPGPNMMWLAILSAVHGVRTAIVAVLGITLGLGLLALLAAFGLATLVAQHPAIYETLRWGGVAFMIYLAVETWLAKPAHVDQAPAGAGRWFIRGVIVNMLNPKAAAVYITLVPAALPQQDASLSHTLLLSAVYVAIATIVHLLIVGFAGRLRSLFAREDMDRRVQKVMAILMLLVAVWLAVSTATSG